MTDPAEFQQRLEEMPEGQRAQMLTLLQAISKPPESFVQLFDRVGLQWERRTLDDKSVVVIEWNALMAAERELQEQGPLLKQLMATEFGAQINKKVQVNENGQVVGPPAEFVFLDRNGDPESPEDEVFQ